MFVLDRLPDLNVAREGPGVASIESQLWVIGGKMDTDDETLHGSVEVFDEKENCWIIQKQDSCLDLRLNKNQECVAVVLDRVVL